MEAKQPTPIQSYLEARRREHGLTKPKLARKIGVATGMVYRWLSDDPYERLRPSSESCKLIAAAFGDDPDRVLALAGHRDEAEVAEPVTENMAELRSRLARLEKLLSPYPRPFWLSIIEANERMVEGWAEGAEALAANENAPASADEQPGEGEIGESDATQRPMKPRHQVITDERVPVPLAA